MKNHYDNEHFQAFHSFVKLRLFLMTIQQYLSSLDLTDKVHTKEDEFASLCSELQVIKDTTLGNKYILFVVIDFSKT